MIHAGGAGSRGVGTIELLIANHPPGGAGTDYQPAAIWRILIYICRVLRNECGMSSTAAQNERDLVAVRRAR